MKKIIILFIVMFSCTSMKAGEKDQFFNINAGFLFPNTLNASVGYEMELKYGNAIELSGEVGNRWHKEDGKIYKDTFFDDYYWDGSLIYKKRLAKDKNSSFRLRIGMQFGAHTGDYMFGAEGGFEYNYTFDGGVQLSLIQKNQVNFLHGDTFKNGLLVGIKIPF